MSWRESDQTFLKSRAWRMPWWAIAIMVTPLVVTFLLLMVFPNKPWIFFALPLVGTTSLPAFLVVRKWSKRKAVVETGCVWCLYPTVNAEGRCPECGKVTTSANRDVAQHVLKHGAPP